MSFDKIYEQQKLSSLIIGKHRYETIYNCLEETSNYDADFCEVGVYKGGSANFIANYLKHKNINKKLFLIDTFKGIPNTTALLDTHCIGDFGDVDFKEIVEFFNDYKNVNIFKGEFNTHKNIIENIKFSFVHLDVDNYISYQNCLEFFYPRMVDGGIILCDDYNVISCKGCTKAVDEFALKNNIKIYNTGYDYTCWLKKKG